MQKTNYKTIALIIGLIAFSFLFVWYVFAQVWDEPGCAPPGCNVPAPLNVSINAQSKEGALVVGNNAAVTTSLIARYGKVGIGDSTPDAKLDVEGEARFDYSGGSTTIRDFSGVQVFNAEGTNGEVRLGAAWGNPGVYSSGDLHLLPGGGSGIYIKSDGYVGIGTTPTTTKLDVQGGTTSAIRAVTTGTYGVYGSGSSRGVEGHGAIGVYGWSGTDYGVYGWGPTGVIGISSGPGVPTANAGVRGAGSTVGVYGWSDTYGVYGYGWTYDFYAAGPGINYGPFTGGHEVKLGEDFSKDTKEGLIVSVTGESQIRKDDKGEVSLSSTLPTIELSSLPNDPAVLGVFVGEQPLPEDHWYKPKKEERFGVVNALGEGRVLVTNANGYIQAGDYITTSSIPGYGQKQDDDILHSYTLGKATENVNWEKITETITFEGKVYKIYLIAVVYTSG